MPQPIPGVHMVWWRIKRRAELRKIAREQQYREFPFQKPFCSPLHAIPQHLNVWEHNSLQPEKPATFCCTGNHWFPCKMTSEEKMHKFHIDDLSLPRFRQCFCLVVPRGEFTSTNQWHFSGMSSALNFCSHFADIISWGNQWWHCKMLAVFSGYSY